MGKLVRLELNNFKSYRGHHVLLFGDAHFTSVIGPNGSGKSNSMDAISFVLGIKSSHLRSSHLRDLIYRGRILKTSKIQADGTAVDETVPRDGEDEVEAPSQREEAQTAWVMAVYEDDTGEEQHWKRTITSAGQSEYRINNRIVTAKEYNEVLEEENILIKARNFLVFQGDVEAIASQSPKDLTRLVEQISGSLEYKAEFDRLQEEADQAIEDQTFKHNQRRGINAEIKTFSEQKKEADNYNRKADERDQAIVTHVLWKLYHFQRVIEESEAEIQRHQEELKEHKRGVEKYEQRLEDAKKEQGKATREVSKADRTIKATEKQIDDKMHDLVPVDEKIAVSNKNLEKIKKRIDEVSKERQSQAQGVEQLQKDLGVVTKAQKKWEDDFQAQAQKQGKQLSDADLQEYNRLKADVNKTAATAQLQLDNLIRQRKTDEETVANLKTHLDNAVNHLEKLKSELKDIESRRDSTNGIIKQTSKNVDEKKKEINKLTSERLRTSQLRTELDEKLHQVLTKLVEADDGRRQTSKELKAKETISTLKRIFPGVRGRLHELCKPKQKKYEVAVSTVLGLNFDAIVVDNDKVARDCVAYMREQRIGTIRTIPLDTIQVKPVNTNLKSMHKGMRLAIDTIEYDHSHERAFASACGNAMICDDIATAKYLCYEKNVQAKAVTLDGTVLHKAGLMTGGRGPQDRNTHKWEETEVANLNKLKDKLLADIAELPQGHKSRTDEETLRGELVGSEQQLSYAKDELKALKQNEESKKKEIAFVQKQIKETRPKYDEQAKSLENLQARIKQCQDEVSTVEDQVFAAFCKRLKFDNVRAYEMQQGTMQQENAQKKLEFTKQKTKLDSQLSFESGRLKTTEERIKTLQAQAQRDRDLIDSLGEEKQAMEAELEEIRGQLESIKENVSSLKATSDEKAERVAEHRRELQSRSKNIDFVVKEIARHETEMQRNASQRYALLRKCKIEEVKLPLTRESAALDSLPVDDLLQGQRENERDPDAMDVDEDPDASSLQAPAVREYGIELDFDELDDDLKEDDSPTTEKSLSTAISNLQAELGSLNPNMRAMDRLQTAQDRLKTTDTAYQASVRQARETRQAFDAVRQTRADLFNKAFAHISAQIGPVYKRLTRSAQYPLGGQAYLDTLGADDDAPFLGGLKYHAMPPLKRFRDMDALSGGEKTIAALALLFAIHSYQPSPFFVLDEVDAALDNANVAKVARYIKEHAGPGMQFIVISLKTGLFQESDCLVGVLRDQGANTSRAVTLDLRKYQPT